MKKTNVNSSATHSTYSHFIGKTYQLSKHTVVIDDIIAEGGFSIVFLVKSNGKKYALKRMYVNNEYDLEACKLEIQIIKSLSEKNRKILRYVDSSIQRQTDDIYEILLLTKYCKLGGLVQLMNDRLNANSRLHESEILNIFCDLCEAVSDLHACGIIHRDIKVENILIDEDHQKSDSTSSGSGKNPGGNGAYNFVLCDFGSATKNFFDRRNQTNSSTLNVQLIADEIQKYTTLSYRSPEMVDLYSNKPITTKSDIWAMGCLLYKLCYFQMPFGESLLAIQDGRYTVPDAKVNYYSKHLNCLINFMLEPDPLKRPDIFQVAYLAFSLAHRHCSIKNKNGSEIPNFSSVNPPMSESEWKKSAISSSSSSTSNANNPKKPGQHSSMSTPIGNNDSSLNSSSNGQQAPTTTVNPRERPKAANINATNNILPLVNSSNSINTQNLKQQQHQQQAQRSAPNKLTVSIKPPLASNSTTTFASPVVATQPQQLGFEDDFSSTIISQPQSNRTPTMTGSPTGQNQQHSAQNSHVASSTDSSVNFRATGALQPSMNQTPTIATNEKKSHRRSASHSSTIFSQPNLVQYANFNTPTVTIHQAQTVMPNQFNYQQQRLTPTQLQQQLQYQYQLQQQQQQQLQQHVPTPQQPQQPTQSNNQIQQTPLLSVLTSNRYINHSRSASASPNVAAKISLAAEMTPKNKPVIPLGTTTTLITNPISGNIQTTDEQPMQLNNTSSTGNKPPPHTAPATNAAGSSNPFDDNFTQLNDNELFGLEFDKLRLKNEPQINAQHAHNQQTTNYTNFMHAKQDAAIVSPSNNNNNNNNTNYKITHKQEKVNRKLEQQHSKMEHGLMKSSSGEDTTYSHSSSHKSSSKNPHRNQHHQHHDTHGKKAQNHDKDDNYDPFRCAPLNLFNTSGKLDNASSASTTNSESISTNDDSFSSSSDSYLSVTSSNELLNRGPNDEPPPPPPLPQPVDSTANSVDPSLVQHPAAAHIHTASTSAFQPYKKQPDPFISAPFEETHRKVSISSTSTSSSVTPTAFNTAGTTNSTNSNRPKKKSDFISEFHVKNEEIIQVIGNQLKVTKTPVAVKKSENPFIAAPFTVKKSKPVIQLINTNQHKEFTFNNNNTAESEKTPTLQLNADTKISFNPSSTHKTTSSFLVMNDSPVAESNNKTPTTAFQPQPQPPPLPQAASVITVSQVKVEKKNYPPISAKPKIATKGGISNMSFDEY